MTDLIGIALLRIFDLYRAFPRRMVDLCAIVTFFAIVLGVILGILVTYVAWILQLLPDSYASDFDLFIYFGMFNEGYSTVEAFVVLVFGLFAIQFRNMGEREIATSTIKQVFANIKAGTWSNFFLAGLFLVILKVALFKPLFDTQADGFGSIGYAWSEDDLGTSKLSRFLNWANGMITWLLSFLPYIVVLHLVLLDQGIKYTRNTVRDVLSVVAAVLVLAFILGAVHSSVNVLLTTKIFPLFQIPFGHSLIPLVFQLMIVVLLIAVFLPAVVLCIVGPVDAKFPIARTDAFTATDEN